MTPDDIKQARALVKRLIGHTSGPWRVGPVDDTRVEDSLGNEVAQIDGDYNQPETWPVMEANARLIAAAPDLHTALTAALDRIEAISALLAEARAEGVREAAKICNENRDVSGWVSRDAILALIDAPAPAPAQPPVPSKGRVTVPEGQTPLDDKLGHPLLDAFNEGIAARDSGECSPYHGHSLEHCIHAAGWVQRDLRLALDKAQPSVQELAFLVLMREGMARGEKAMRKFPQPNYVITKFAEEAGEVVKAAVHHAEDRETRENVLDEIRDTIGMLWRLWIEGDEVHGLRALASEAQP